MWRPENWKSPYRPHRFMDTGCRAPEACEGCDAEVFKAGADAMLEALRKKHGVRITEATKMVTQPIFEQGNGYLVFIPDEKEEK